MGLKLLRDPGSYVALIVLLILGAQALDYSSYLCDDTLIALRYARNLLLDHGIVWNEGERVEGYTELLWVLCCSALGALGLDLITASRILGFLGSAAAVLSVVFAYRTGSHARSWVPLFAVLPLVLSAPLAAWTMGGMASSLLAGLLGWAIVLSFPLCDPDPVGRVTILRAGLFYGLICLTRADGFVVVAAAACGVLFATGLRRESLRRAGILVAIPVLTVIAQLLFRLEYYGDWLPNTAYAKVSISSSRLSEGAAYVGRALVWLSPVFLFAVLCVIVSAAGHRTRQRVWFLTALMAISLAYIVVIGGDIFPAHRFIVPILLIAAFMTGEFCLWLDQQPKRVRLAGASAAACLLAFLFVLQRYDPSNLLAKSEKWVRQGRPVGVFLKKAFASQKPLIAVDSAGCVPYWSELPSLDMLGLNDRYLAHHPPPTHGKGWPGHELGDGRYVLERRPDLVLFGPPWGIPYGVFRSGREMQKIQRFWDDYTLVNFRAKDLHTDRLTIWVRRESPRIGVQRTPDKVVVPSLLFNARPGTLAHLDEEENLCIRVTSKEPAEIRQLALGQGRWRIEVNASGKVGVRVRRADQEGPDTGGSGPTFDLAADARVSVFLNTESEPVTVWSVEFHRAKQAADARMLHLLQPWGCGGDVFSRASPLRVPFDLASRLQGLGR